MTGTRAKLVRTAVAAVFVLPFVVVSAAPSFASHPTQGDVASAKAKVAAVDHQLEVVVEQYNQARAQYQLIQQKLATARSQMQQAQAQAGAARSQLGQRAAEAYTGMGSQLDTLLGAQDFSQFSDRLEFMGALAQSDADLATAADASRQQAAWATQQYDNQLTDAKNQLDAVNAKRNDLGNLLGQAESLYKQTSSNYAQYVAQQRAALLAQQQQDTTGGTGTGTTPPSDPPPSGGNTGGYNPPPPDVSGASRAINAAEQEIGVQYVFGAADPSVGFDCSGLTMWAWAQAGVSLPHSAAMQYAVLPHVAIGQEQPGDLLFFYEPIAHVALYIGGGVMIHARHPGPGGQVQTTVVATYGTPVVGVARP
jgi:peptidoglycan DL-endopeptidase CwlO